MNAELMNEIQAHLSATPGLTVLDESAAAVLRSKVARRFAFPESSAWWWEHVPVPSRSFGYADGGGLSLLSKIVPVGATRVYLFVTDDDPPPWLCLSGPPQLIMSMRVWLSC